MERILSLSYGKDSIACFEACRRLGWKIDRAVHVEIMATPTIPADLPPMVEFKAHADNIIKQKYGVEVEHIHTPKSYQECFYMRFGAGKHEGRIYGFPMQRGAWCNSRLKMSVLDKFNKPGIMQYIGIAADEPKRFHVLNERKVSPLKAAQLSEQQCREFCAKNGLLSPIYTQAARGGCWFCHNQGVEQLRLLRRQYPKRWALLMQWDKDSPVTFKPDGHTVRDFEERFALEDTGVLLPNDTTFKWEQLNGDVQLKLF